MKTIDSTRQVWLGRGTGVPFRFGLLLMPGFTLIGLGATRVMNRQVGDARRQLMGVPLD